MKKNNDHAQTGARLGIGRSKVFELWSSGALASVKIGRRRFSTDTQIDDYIGRLEAQANGGDAA